VLSGERVEVTQVKICGITNKEDALAAVQSGAAALGFIFYQSSPRYITPENALKIISALPDKVIKVGVFVNEKADEIKRIMDCCALDMIQLHGDETPDFCRQFPSSIIIKALALRNDGDVNFALNYHVAAILIDSRHAGLYGGTGKKANWDLACRVKENNPLILSGGLNAENITEAMQTVTPAALDINSGVEASPGKKDHKKLAKIFDIIRSVQVETGNSQIIFKKRGKYESDTA
jgi:phosphoribosylanthranilate isomerase